MSFAKRRAIRKLRRQIQEIEFRATRSPYDMCRGDREKLNALRNKLAAWEAGA